ncbi:hypothetical protein BN903_102 [Halorubrum sp. AJ67]|nr:hypothetical protein BN903_102 [Halorubrum sp. AJ67]
MTRPSPNPRSAPRCDRTIARRLGGRRNSRNRPSYRFPNVDQ